MGWLDIVQSRRSRKLRTARFFLRLEMIDTCESFSREEASPLARVLFSPDYEVWRPRHFYEIEKEMLDGADLAITKCLLSTWSLAYEQRWGHYLWFPREKDSIFMTFTCSKFIDVEYVSKNLLLLWVKFYLRASIWRRICHLTTEDPAVPLAEVFVYEPLETVDELIADLLVISVECATTPR